MIPRRLLLSFACIAALILWGAASGIFSAEEGKKLKSQTIKVPVSPKYVVNVTFDMVQIPAGKITLKDEKGVETEHAIKPIWIGKTEVTWDVYDVFWQRLDVADPWERQKMVEGRSRPSMPFFPPDRGWGHDGSPAITLNFQSATTFCEWLSNQTGKKFRLPTSAEWEYACRCGRPWSEAFRGPVKLDAKELDKVASDKQTHPVAKKQPNAWGLYDMLGNAAEWVILDPSKGASAVAGGSFRDIAQDVHSARREAYSPAWQKDDPQDPKGRSWLSNGEHVGLRLVMEE